MKVLFGLLASLLAASPAMATGLTIDGSATGHAMHTTVVSSAPFSTHGPTVVVACSHAEWLNPGTSIWAISSVVDSAGLTWTKRSATPPMVGGRGGAWNGLGCWWANAPAALTGDTVMATWAPLTPFDGATISVFAVAGSANPASPWDPSVALPAVATSTVAGIPSASLSTSGLNDMIIGVVGAGDFIGYSPGYVGSGFTFVNGISMFGTANYSSMGVEEMISSTPLVGQSVGWAAGSNGWVMIADALSPTGGTAGNTGGGGTGGGGTGGGGTGGGTCTTCPAGAQGIPGEPGPPGVCTGSCTAPTITAGANVTITGTWPNITISSAGGGTGGGGGGGGVLSMKVTSPPALNVITANQIQAGALDYMAITDAAAQVTAGPVPISVQAPGLADVQVWTHGALNIHLTNNGSGTFTGNLDLSREPNGPILVGFYGFDQVAPLIPGTELVGKYILFVNGGASAVPPFPVAAAGMTLAFADEFATLNVSPCVKGSYPCVPTSETATWYPNKGDGGDFGDAWFGHPGEVDNPFTVTNGFLRIRMTHCQPADNCVDPYGYGRTWKAGILASAYPDGTTVFDGIRNPVMGDGYYEAKILLPDGGSPDGAGLNGASVSGGTWAAWWMLTINAAKCPVKTGACDPALVNGNDELDIIEQYGKFPSWLTSGTHVYGTNVGAGAYIYHSQPSADIPVLLPVKDFTWDFHRFGYLIKNGIASYYVDDVPLGKPTAVGIFPGSPQINWFVLLNLALGGGWPENAPPAQYFDYWIKDVRYFH